MRFEMNNEDITNGVKYDSQVCPVALCMQRTLGKKEVYVGAGVIEIDNSIYLDVPEEVIKFVRNFDVEPTRLRRLWRYFFPLRPITFELEVENV